MAESQADIKAMLKQIAKLEIYIQEVERGYKIARAGLTTINEFKHGEFNLHNLFFSSLKTVSPRILKYERIAEIISDQISIIHQFKGLSKINTPLTASEIDYIARVYDHISVECGKDLNALISVLTNGELEMNDQERIKRIDRISLYMKEKTAFTTSFSSKTNRICLERTGQANEINILKILE
jgi:hypothetical protein